LEDISIQSWKKCFLGFFPTISDGIDQYLWKSFALRTLNFFKVYIFIGILQPIFMLKEEVERTPKNLAMQKDVFKIENAVVFFFKFIFHHLLM